MFELKFSNLSIYLQIMMNIFHNISLRDRNSFHTDVVARELIEYSDVEDLITLFSDPSFAPNGWIALGGGNNILFTRDVQPTLLTPVSRSIEVVAESADEVVIRVAGGEEWDDVVEWSVDRGLWGVENLSLIPSKACAAPIQNIGAYGVEICDVVEEVEYFDPSTLAVVRLKGYECGFGYRESIFKGELKGRVIVTAITLRLSKSSAPRLGYADVAARVEGRGGATLRNIRDVICEIRREKLPDTAILGNAGSFFKNPIVEREVAEQLKELHPAMPLYDVDGDAERCKLAAGWLIDQAGMKGYREGCVGVHERQALVLVNYGSATGKEVVALARRVQSRVVERFGVSIDFEVNIL